MYVDEFVDEFVRPTQLCTIRACLVTRCKTDVYHLSLHNLSTNGEGTNNPNNLGISITMYFQVQTQLQLSKLLNYE